MAEMRRLFGMLRTEGENPGLALAPQPGLGELERLVRQVGGAQMSVRLDVEGDPVPLSPGVDLAAYRIAQEGLTNALRHADASEVRVLVRYSPQRLDVEVSDNGRGLPVNGHDGHGSHGGGHGLLGIRERVGLYGGTLDLTPGPSGGVRLAASLPLQEAP
jgi:signal transduction histidine kinase